MSEYLIKTDKEINNCYECPFCKANDDLDSEDYRLMYCSYPNIGEFVTDYDACRHPDCPLVEVPPHGRLIDEADLRDRAYKRQIRDRISFHDALALALMEAPIIIEASKERE